MASSSSWTLYRIRYLDAAGMIFRADEVVRSGLTLDEGLQLCAAFGEPSRVYLRQDLLLGPGIKVPGGTIYRSTKHKCPKPDPTPYAKGDQFHCDCGRKYVLGKNYYDDKVWDEPEAR